jgi:hypothetical protein
MQLQYSLSIIQCPSPSIRYNIYVIIYRPSLVTHQPSPISRIIIGTTILIIIKEQSQTNIEVTKYVG